MGLCQKRPDSSIVYINKAIDMSRAINDHLRVAKGLNCLGIAYNAKSDFEKSFMLYREALDILENEKSLETQSAVYYNIGNIYILDFQTADTCTCTCQKQIRDITDTNCLCEIPTNIGRYQYREFTI